MEQKLGKICITSEYILQLFSIRIHHHQVDVDLLGNFFLLRASFVSILLRYIFKIKFLQNLDWSRDFGKRGNRGKRELRELRAIQGGS